MSLRRFIDQIHELTDGRALALFRIFFGVLLFYEVNHNFEVKLVEMGIVGPKLLFPYEGFEWVKPMSLDAMNGIMGVLAACTLMIAFGLLYRVAIVIFFLGYAYIVLLDKGYFNNHLYLFVLLAFLLALAPAHRAWSLDRLLFKRFMKDRGVPYWCWLMLRMQVVIVYFYGGIAKLNADWLLRGEPMRTSLETFAQGSSMPGFWSSAPVVSFFVYGGVLFDLAIGPLLWWKRTRKYALPFMLLFNVMNHFLFSDIGVFPFFMIASTVLFFDPAEIARLFSGKSRERKSKAKKVEVTAMEPRRMWPLVHAVLVPYLLFQLLFPLRWMVLPGNADWTTIGQRFSWRMKITTRAPLQIAYAAYDQQGRKIPVRLEGFINNHQVMLLASDPRASVRFAKWLKQEVIKRGVPDPRITAEIMISYNKRPYRYLWPPEQDLSAVVADPSDPDAWVPPFEPGPEHMIMPQNLEQARRESMKPRGPRKR